MLFRSNEYLSNRAVLNCGEATAAEVDQEVMRILKEAYEEAKRLLSENREVMDKIAEFLIEKETITGKEFMRIFREIKGIPVPQEDNKEKEKSGRIRERRETGDGQEAAGESLTDTAAKTGNPEGKPEIIVEEVK